jgi:hypothetical protein
MEISAILAKIPGNVNIHIIMRSPNGNALPIKALSLFTEPDRAYGIVGFTLRR